MYSGDVCDHPFPMLIALLLVILFPQTVLFIPKLIMPKFI